MDAALRRRGPGGRRLSSLATFAAAGALVAACGSGPSATLDISGADNGHTVTVAHGQKVVVTLPGAAWQFTLTPPFGPRAEVSSRLSSGRTITDTVVFVAGARGSATVAAHWSGCGPGQCPSGRGRFRVQVVVTG